MFSLNKNLIIRIEKNSLLHLYNTENRANIFFSDYAIIILNNILEAKNLKILKKIFKDKTKIKYYDKTEFSLWKNLYENPNFLAKNVNFSKGSEIINTKIFCDKLIEKNIIFKNKKKIIRKKLFSRFQGDINSQLLTESFHKKIKLHKWWENQKFESQFKLKNTPYKYIQSIFLQKYFKNNLKNKTVMEVGCGNGHYCFQMSKFAARVVGLDYEEDFIRAAKKKNKNNLKFIKFDISKNIKFNKIIHKKKFDYIFMIDFFLFLFQPHFQRELFKKKITIFNNIKKFLQKNGKLVIIDPHFFWLTPFFGNKNNPFGILTEYNIKKFSTTPTLQSVANFFNKTGFYISNIYEPEIDNKYKKINKLNFNFYRNFPQWIVYEIKKK